MMKKVVWNLPQVSNPEFAQHLCPFLHYDDKGVTYTYTVKYFFRGKMLEQLNDFVKAKTKLILIVLKHVRPWVGTLV